MLKKRNTSLRLARFNAARLQNEPIYRENTVLRIGDSNEDRGHKLCDYSSLKTMPY